MGRKPGDTSIVVADGITLKLNGGVYHYYFRLDGRQHRASTKTRSDLDAKLIALNAFREAKTRAERGDSGKAISFNQLKREYLQFIQNEGKFKYHSETIERHYLPFWSKFADISKIKKSDVFDYIQFRKGKGDKPPSNLTINRELTVLRQLFRFASDKDYTVDLPAVTAQSQRNKRGVRKHFTSDQYAKLYTTARRRSEEPENVVRGSIHHKLRVLLYDYIMILANTGLRVDEIGTVTWEQVDLAGHKIHLNQAGKTRSTRTLIVRKYGDAALQRIRERRLEYLKANGGELDPGEKVIALPDGTPVKSFKKGFNELLKACGFKYPSPADKHTLTSLRHTYATKRLTTARGQRATMTSLSYQMGTSIRMIEQHYGHLKAEDFYDELRGH